MSQRPSKDEISGMTMNERLFACGLVEDFDSALRRGDRKSFTAVLTQVEFTEEQAVAYTEKYFESLRDRLGSRRA